MGFIKDFFDLKNVVTGLKALAINVALAIIGFAFWMLWNSITFFAPETLMGIGILIYLAIFIFGWGYLAKNFWGWK